MDDWSELWDDIGIRGYDERKSHQISMTRPLPNQTP